MITLKIISATDLPAADSNGLSDPYVKIIPRNYDYPLSYILAKTETIKKTLNPKWNQDILIPFPIFQSIRLEFWDANVILHDTLLGWADIYPTSEDIYQNNQQVKTANITLCKSSKNSTFSYLFGSTIRNFPIKQVKNPKKIFVYLTLDPPLNPNNQNDVSLLVYGITNDGTIIDSIYDLQTRGELEASHFGPSGPTQVFYFDRPNLSNEQYFFIIKSTNYTGNAQLIFVSGPEDTKMKKYIDKFRIFNNKETIKIKNEEKNIFSIQIFPIILKFLPKSVEIESISIKSSIQSQISTNNNNNCESIIFNLTEEIGHLICPKNKSIHHRFEIFPGNKYSLIDAYSHCGIDKLPSEITVGLGWDTETDLDASILIVQNDGTQKKPVCYLNPYDKDKTIRTTGDNRTGYGKGDDERIHINLSKISSDIKYLAIVITSYEGLCFDKINGAFCRIVDSDSGKEVMYLRISKKEEHTGLLFGILGRVDGVWDMWPCLEYFDGKLPDDAKKFFDEFLKNGKADQILSV